MERERSLAESAVGELLGDEPGCEGNAGHRRNREQRYHVEPLPAAGQRGQLAKVAGSRLVVDDAHDHEERGLERGVGDEEHPPRGRRSRCAGPEQDHHEAELADGAEREEQLQVVLTKGAQTAEQQRRGAHREHERPPVVRGHERRGQPADQVHAGRDHGRRVQVGAHRRRRGHGAGQPRVEGILRRLREGSDENEHDGDRDRPAPCGRVGQDLAEQVGARFLGEDHHAGEQGEAAGAGHEQRVQRGGVGPWLGVPVANEQERRDRRQFPACVEEDDVIRLDQAEHRPGEQDQQPGQTAEIPGRWREVAGGVDEDGDADQGNDQRHRGGETIEAEIDRQPQPTHPRGLLSDHPTAGDVAELRADPQRGGHHRYRPYQERTATQARSEGDECQTDHTEDAEDDDHPW